MCSLAVSRRLKHKQTSGFVCLIISLTASCVLLKLRDYLILIVLFTVRNSPLDHEVDLHGGKMILYITKSKAVAAEEIFITDKDKFYPTKQIRSFKDHKFLKLKNVDEKSNHLLYVCLT